MSCAPLEGDVGAMAGRMMERARDAARAGAVGRAAALSVDRHYTADLSARGLWKVLDQAATGMPIDSDSAPV